MFQPTVCRWTWWTNKIDSPVKRFGDFRWFSIAMCVYPRVRKKWWYLRVMYMLSYFRQVNMGAIQNNDWSLVFYGYVCDILCKMALYICWFNPVWLLRLSHEFIWGCMPVTKLGMPTLLHPSCACHSPSCIRVQKYISHIWIGCTSKQTVIGWNSFPQQQPPLMEGRLSPRMVLVLALPTANTLRLPKQQED